MEKIFITFYFGAFELNVFGILGYSSHTWTFQCRVLSVFTLSKERDLPRCGNEFRDEKQTQKKVDMSNLPAVFFGGEQWSSKTPMWHSIFLDGLLISMACKESPKKKTGERVFDGFENIPDVLQQLDQAFGEYCSPIAKCKIRSYPILEGFFRYPNRSKLLQMIRVGLSFKVSNLLEDGIRGQIPHKSWDDPPSKPFMSLLQNVSISSIPILFLITNHFLVTWGSPRSKKPSDNIQTDCLRFRDLWKNSHING